MTTKFAFEPDYAVAPGATLKETLDARGISQTALALRTGLAEKTISQIINGVAPITYETAEKLELVLDVPAGFWNRREMSYRAALARVEATQRLASELEWLEEIPLKELKDRGLVRAGKDAQKTDLVRLALKFFGVSSVEAWRNAWANPVAQYRGPEAQHRRPGYVAAWLRIGELQAATVETDPFDAGLFAEALNSSRALTVLPDWRKKLPGLFAPAGVAVVFTKEMPGAGVSGATRWLTKDKALMQLSLKYKSDDQVWFTFFHEAGHIALHGKKQVFVEFGHSEANDQEREANEFARDRLIPRAYAKRLPSLRTRAQIKEFAALLGISPGIVVGRLQHEKLVWSSAFNDLKVKLHVN